MSVWLILKIVGFTVGMLLGGIFWDWWRGRKTR